MEILDKDGTLVLYKEKGAIGSCRYAPWPDGTAGARVLAFSIDPAWRCRGYGTWLGKALLARTGGYVKNGASRHTAPAPQGLGGALLLRRLGFVPGPQPQDPWQRLRRPDPSAVVLAQQLVKLYCPAPRLAIDATCGNGGDTAFLCGLAAAAGGHVLAMDKQPDACGRTRARLAEAGFDPALYDIVCDDHAHLARYAAPGTADAVMFNFGWLPGADHAVHTDEASSLSALAAALDLLRPGGVLSAVLYSGKVIGDTEKQAVRRWLAGLPLTRYTVLTCDFANWADTAPLPCLVVKK